MTDPAPQPADDGHEDDLPDDASAYADPDSFPPAPEEPGH